MLRPIFNNVTTPSKQLEGPKLGPLIPIIDTILEADKTAPPKQRHALIEVPNRLENRLFLVNVTLRHARSAKRNRASQRGRAKNLAAMRIKQMIDVRRRFSSLARRTPGFFFAAEKANAHDCHCRLLCTVQSTSMRFNGLFLKPGDSFRSSRLIPAMRPARGNLLQSFQAFFAPRFMPDGLARNQAVTHSTGSCVLASRKGIVSLMR
jgi:hypothetical protein